MKADAYELQQNIFFTEYDLDVDTTIFKYDSVKNEVAEVGKVKGCFYKCIVDSKETYITGLLYDFDEKKTGIACYDLTTREIIPYELPDTIDEIAATDEWHISLLYNGGNKFLVSYDDENEHEMWLFYDLDTGQYDVIEGEEYGTNQFLGVYNNTLWYVAFAGGTLYQYDLETGTKIKVLDSVTSVAIKADIGKIAYTKNDNRKKIYLYDMNSKKTTHLTWTRWNTYYELSRSESRWGDDGRMFFCVSSFPGLFGASEESLMVYDMKSGKQFCIYKVKNTLHQFRYVASGQ